MPPPQMTNRSGPSTQYDSEQDPISDQIDNVTKPTRRLTNKEIFDQLPYMEQKRRHTNKAVRKICKKMGVYFVETWRGLQKPDKSVNLDLYADDGLHLNEHGIQALGRYIEGTTACLLDRRKLCKPKRKNMKKFIEEQLVKSKQQKE